MRTVMITGADSGLGLALVNELRNEMDVIAIHHDSNLNFMNDVPFEKHFNCDLQHPQQIYDLANAIEKRSGKKRIEVLINCAGTNALNWIRDLSLEEWDRVMNVNARAPFLLTKLLLNRHLLCSGSAIVNITSNAATVPMTCSLAYNASKAALAMMTLQMARELTRSEGIYVFGVTMAKMKNTRLSDYVDEAVPRLRGWTSGFAEQYHRASKLYVEDAPADKVARFIAPFILNTENYPYLTGTIISYGV